MAALCTYPETEMPWAGEPIAGDETRRMGQAVTPQISGLKTTDMYFFLTVLEAESPRSRCQQSWCPLRPPSWT